VKLLELIRQGQPLDYAQQATLNVIVTNSWIISRFADTMSEFGITPPQYNVLRILRGAHPEPVSCGYIGARLLDRTPDVTRLLDRLSAQHLVLRQRAEHDRRVVLVGITDAGMAILDGLDGPMRDAMNDLTRHLTQSELHTLCELMEKMRTSQNEPRPGVTAP
jgi:DNA-binding MarR family transcriptional regulator